MPYYNHTLTVIMSEVFREQNESELLSKCVRVRLELLIVDLSFNLSGRKKLGQWQFFKYFVIVVSHPLCIVPNISLVSQQLLTSQPATIHLTNWNIIYNQHKPHYEHWLQLKNFNPSFHWCGHSIPPLFHLSKISQLSICCNNKTSEIQIKIAGIHTPELTSNFLFTCHTSVQPEQENSRDVVTAMLRSLDCKRCKPTNNFHKITLKYFRSETRELTAQLFM